MSIWAYAHLDQDVVIRNRVIPFLKTVDLACVNLGCCAVWFVALHMNVKARFNWYLNMTLVNCMGALAASHFFFYLMSYRMEQSFSRSFNVVWPEWFMQYGVIPRIRV